MYIYIYIHMYFIPIGDELEENVRGGSRERETRGRAAIYVT